MQGSLSRPVIAGSPQRAGRDAGVRLAAAASLWLSLLLVGYWWISGRGVEDLATTAGALTSAGRLTGLVASVLLLAQVVLMARVPLLETAFGQDRLARIHRCVGFCSFNLMVAHVVLITWGYAGDRVVGWLPTFWDLTWHDPGMLLADAGTAALCLVVATSVRAARRRLRYESWHLLHLYAYLGAGLALPHQLWTGQEFASSPGRTVFWWTTWALAAAAVLVWRVALPVARNLRHQLRVESVVRESIDVVSVTMTGRRLDRLRVAPGQFFAWRFLGRPGQSRANPYSLSAAPDGRRLRITVQEVGDSSGSLATLRRGSRVWIEGPYGRLSERARSHDKVALIGAGVGVTPLRALAEGLSASDMVLLHRWSDTPLFAEELRQLSRTRPLTVLDIPGHRRHARLLAQPGRGSARPRLRRLGAAVLGARHRRARRLRLRPGGVERPGPRLTRRSGLLVRQPPSRDLRLVRNMKRITYWILSTVTAVVLLFGYHTSRSSQMPASTPAPFVASGTASSSRTATTGSGTGSKRAGSSASAHKSAQKSAQNSAKSAPKASTVTGDTVQTRWGPVQVQLALTGGTITKVTVLQYPNGNSQDAEINSQALPILVQETQQAQSAKIDMVSGATYTSDGYIQSLQSALDKVNA